VLRANERAVVTKAKTMSLSMKKWGSPERIPKRGSALASHPKRRHQDVHQTQKAYTDADGAEKREHEIIEE